VTALELGISQDAIARLRRHPLVSALTQGRPRRGREHAVYFDAPDLALARAGIALCVRRAGRTSVQSVVQLDAEGVHALATADTVLLNDAPELARIPDERLRNDLLRALDGRSLAPAFEVTLARETRHLREDANELVFAIDTGSLHTPGGDAPLGTLRLDLERGDPAYPAQLVLELIDAFPFRLDVRHPAARARALLLGEPARPRRAAPVAVAPDATLEDLLAAVVEACLAQIAGNEEAAIVGIDPEGVHQLRVGLRRLRSALSFFGDVVPERQRAVLRAEIGGIARALGPARDLDVLAASVLEPLLAARPDDTALAQIESIARSERATEAERVRALLRSSRFPRLVLEVRHWAARRAWRDQPLSAASARLFLPAREAVTARLEKRHRRTRKLLRRHAVLTPDERHRVRIEAKKLRYAAEFSAALFPAKRVRRYARRLAALQNALGVANDALTAESIVTRLAERLGGGVAIERAAGLVVGWSAHAAQSELARVPGLAERFEDVPRFWPRPAAERRATP
jgi:inorganic triphosphatase YgiF